MDNQIRILIVEDEFMISEDIAMRLLDFGYSVAGVAPSATKALSILENENVDLALLDINIKGDMDGIELSKIINSKYKIPFIFLTSLANKTVFERAKECQPSAYIIKPFNDRQMQISVELALQNYAEGKRIDNLNSGMTYNQNGNSVLPINNALFIKKDSHFERVNFEDILYLESETGYTTIHTRKKKYLYSSVLKSFEEKLPTSIFKRVHRSYVININNVTGFGGNCIFIDDVTIPVSKNVRDEIFKLFNLL
ncbi:MAG: LytTR family transcriptional regulator DNA-binding domain-containing protein [Prolixibacteraceae bacterium]|nr:LytTR family transcriptional regulator DNA-binding domain-containing protein [Prolixibacteraceae bacterium]